MATTENSKDIKASPETIYRAFTEPSALAFWLAPGKMTGRIHRFDLRIGGEYQMSLFYPPSDNESRGKTAEKEDRFTSRFIELTPCQRIVQAINFDSSDPAILGEMIMEVSLNQLIRAQGLRSCSGTFLRAFGPRITRKAHV